MRRTRLKRTARGNAHKRCLPLLRAQRWPWDHPRRSNMRRILVALLALAAAGLAACGQAERSESGGGGDTASYPEGRLSIMAPADPGGGWDETARALQDSARKGGLAGNVEVYNVPGAGGTIGLSQLASKRSGDPNQLMVMGLVMLGAIEQNKPPVD